MEARSVEQNLGDESNDAWLAHLTTTSTLVLDAQRFVFWYTFMYTPPYLELDGWDLRVCPQSTSPLSKYESARGLQATTRTRGGALYDTGRQTTAFSLPCAHACSRRGDQGKKQDTFESVKVLK
jgi:hypothetical protein